MITLKTLPQATAQEVFDQVATHLLKQRVASRNFATEMCAYRGAKGRKCAAGCLVSDEEYSTEMENLAWDQINYPKRKFTVPQEHMKLITALQVVHDSADDEVNVGIGGDAYDYWLRRLRTEAHDRGLSDHKLRYRVIEGECMTILFTENTQSEAEQQLTYALIHGHDAYLQCPGDF